jgi:plastocyanin
MGFLLPEDAVRTRFRLTALLAAAGLACSGSDSGPTDNDQDPVGDILVRNNFFDPGNFQTAVGDEVVWAWTGSAVTHNVTFDDAAPGSPNQSSGTFARTFAAAGQYPYHCTIHGPAMSGTITVAEVGGSGGAWDY